MELLDFNIPLDCKIFDASDLHSGPHGYNREAFNKLLDEVENDNNARLFLKGDLVDCITPSDSRFSSHSVDITNGHRNAQDHADLLIADLKRVAHKILFLQWGNHEFKIANTFDITKYMCKELDVKFGGYIAVATFRNDSRRGHLFKILATHGRKSISSLAKDPIQSEANMKASLKKHLDSMRFTDCIYQTMGHAHKLIVVEPTINKEVMLTTTTKNIKQDYRSPVPQNSKYIPSECRYFVCSGTFLKTFAPSGLTNYAEMAQYGPVELGCAEIVVQDGAIVNVKKRLF